MNRQPQQLSGRELEKVLARAMGLAQQSRDAKGLGKIDTRIRKKGSGRWVGPSAYRMTLWLRPWEYLEVIETMRREHFKGSVTAFLLRGYRAHQKQQHGRTERARERSRVAAVA